MRRTVVGVMSAMLVLAWLPPALPSAGASAQPGSDPATLRCAYAAAAVPEFGGAVLAEQSDGARVLHVWLTDAGATDRALAALRERCPAYQDVVIEDADYSYAQLRQWQEQVAGLPSVTRTGVDARTNRLTVGLADLDDSRRDVVAELTRLGVPAGAVNLVESGPVQIPIRDPVSAQPLLTLAAAGLVLVAAAAVVVVWLSRRRRPRPPARDRRASRSS